MFIYLSFMTGEWEDRVTKRSKGMEGRRECKLRQGEEGLCCVTDRISKGMAGGYI